MTKYIRINKTPLPEETTNVFVNCFDSVRFIREVNGKSQKELAAYLTAHSKANIVYTQNDVSRLERGLVSYRSLAKVRDVNATLGVDPHRHTCNMKPKGLSTTYCVNKYRRGFSSRSPLMTKLKLVEDGSFIPTKDLSEEHMPIKNCDAAIICAHVNERAYAGSANDTFVLGTTHLNYKDI